MLSIMCHVNEGRLYPARPRKTTKTLRDKTACDPPQPSACKTLNYQSSGGRFFFLHLAYQFL
jgi:hypothetical protein